MKEIKMSCFIIMPFDPGLHYFYLFLKHHLNTKYKIKCIRADEKFTDKAFSQKIIELIDKSDFIIADITGNKPNVMYELGIAHAKGKKVILLTQTTENIPTDIQHIEYIHYNNDHGGLLKKLDKAFNDLFSVDYTLYERAQKIFYDFIEKTNTSKAKIASFEEFQKIIILKPDYPHKLENDHFAKEFLLPIIITNSNEREIMRNILQYITR